MISNGFFVFFFVIGLFISPARGYSIRHVLGIIIFDLSIYAVYIRKKENKRRLNNLF
jgi:hypothetical protein